MQVRSAGWGRPVASRPGLGNTGVAAAIATTVVIKARVAVVGIVKVERLH